MERFIMAAAAMICCACTEVVENEMIPHEGVVTETKLAVGDYVVAGDTVDVYVFNDDELMQMDTYQRAIIGKNTMDVASTAGPKVVAMVVNGNTGRYSWSASNTYNYIRTLDAEFVRESLEHPTMSGECKLSGKSNKPFEIEVEPIMSKVILRSIRCDFEGMAYEGEKMTDAKVYLTNVSDLCKVMAKGNSTTRSVINAGRLVEGDMKKMKDSEMVVKSLPLYIGKDFLTVNKTLYCYPNTNQEDSETSPFTRMVIEGKIEGVTWYYPININRDDICLVEGTPGIERNKSYVFDVTIKRTGSTDPDKPISLQEVSVVCEVVPWKEKENRDEVF